MIRGEHGCSPTKRLNFNALAAPIQWAAAESSKANARRQSIARVGSCMDRKYIYDGWDGHGQITPMIATRDMSEDVLPEVGLESFLACFSDWVKRAFC